tara:strand:+ start:234 stop:572 length:339 start_codon:yes stop_codon:yes gene_type:complete
MPLINLRTSLNLDKKKEKLLKVLSAELSSLTGKPENYVMTSIDDGVQMTFAGSSEPCCYIEVKSIGALNPSKMSEAFCEIISAHTGIKENRIYIEFSDVPAKSWGWDGRTFG